MRDVVILSAVRTPIGRFLGGLSTVPAPRLGAIAIRGALERAGIRAYQVDEVIMGNVLSAGLGQAPARQAALGAGIPETVPATTVNKMCGSSLKAVMLAAQAIRSGEADVVVAGGMENMSLAPYLLDRARTGYRIGNGAIVDSMLQDGLVDAYKHIHMGNCCELLNREYRFTREEQDAFAAQSYRRALAAMKDGAFAAELVPVEVPQHRDGVARVEEDEEPSRVNFDKIPTLPPAFEEGGTLTVANSSSISDGAAATVVVAAEVARRLARPPLARVVGQAGAAGAPEWFTVQPAAAIRRLLDRVNWTLDEVDLVEINEAFAATFVACERVLKFDRQSANVNGGAIALGHPVGQSGTRVVVTLLHELKRRGLSLGLASLCVGGGQGSALIVECTA
jgi:acetyl-CoA C-acetyltransferase